MRRGVGPATPRRYRPPGNPWMGFSPGSTRSIHPPFGEGRDGFPTNHGPSLRSEVDPSVHLTLSNFVIELRPGVRGFRRVEVEELLVECKLGPENVNVLSSGPVAATLFFRQWVDTLETMVRLWELRLEGKHFFTPKLIRNIIMPSDEDELRSRLQTTFGDHVRAILEGEEVKKQQNELRNLSNKITKVQGLLGKYNKMADYEKLTGEKKGLLCERDLISKRLAEFRSSMSCILNYLKGNHYQEFHDEGIEMFRFNGDYDWSRIYHLILRECRRLKDGLPLYAFRREILHQIHTQQIMVLIGETGSGKSTQLVQFLVDSGIAANESIICTQPRKIAAISLAQRVREETNGCYEHDSIICYPTFSSSQQFMSKVIYMTDYCFLQHYMNDKNLSGISCILIDEAHERSMNTDLLLALIKALLSQKLDMRVIIMSATANADQLSKYFFGCGTFHVVGRNFPVDIRYVPCASGETSGSGSIASYVLDVLRMANEIHKTEKEGTILAFLTSQMEVEWACGKFQAPAAVALALHGKLSCEEQVLVFQSYPGKRKVIFSTNLAETSLTIPGVKYVIDSGMVKESRFEPGTGMNVLRVCSISQSSSNQRAGRAGRTEPGRCYRLYSKHDFELMPPHQEPEIRRVHLGVAVLRILALGIKSLEHFDFVDAPSDEAIDMAIRNLVQLGAVTLTNDFYDLTEEGRYLVKMGIEPRLGKLILSCFHHHLGREGLVLAAVMANSSSIFCRVGNDEDKLKSDRLKVQFCHRDGDLFTLLSVYKEWERLPSEKRNKWCWENSINAKSMRRCQDTVHELDKCLKNELRIIIPTYWRWDPHNPTMQDKHLKKAILSSLSENVAMYSGHDQLGYEVALTGKHVHLHPSCSLLMFGEKPSWVVFGEILSVSNQYLVCVSAFDIDSLPCISPSLFDVSKMESQKLQMRKMTGFGSTLLKKICGKANSSLTNLISQIRTSCMDIRIGVEVKVDQNEILVFASSKDMEKAFGIVNDALEYERKWLQDECMEKCLYPAAAPPLALFGAGAEIKHLELKKRCLSVDVFYSDVNMTDDKELLMYLEERTSGSICSFQKFTGTGQDNEGKWGRITFLSPDSAKEAADLNEVEFRGSLLKITPSRTMIGGNHKTFPFPAVKAKICWPRRQSKGFGIVKCDRHDVDSIVHDFYDLAIQGRYLRCESSAKYMDSVVIGGLDKELSEAEILDELKAATNRRILDFFLVRGDAVNNPSCVACEEALLREISPFMSKTKPHGNFCQAQVFPPEPKDAFMKALITFDGRLHLEAAKALEEIEGKVLAGCHSWQKIKCQGVFHSYVYCPAPVYSVIENQLLSLLARFRHQRGAECELYQVRKGGPYRVKISANATKTVAELRRLLEQLTKGEIVDDASLTPAVLHHLFCRDGIMLMKSIERETETHILFDRHTSVRVFGPPNKISVAKQKLVESLLAQHDSKQLEIHLRGGHLPGDLMKEVVKKFGPDLHGLKEKVPGAEFTLNTQRHIIYIHGNQELKQKVQEIVYSIPQKSGSLNERPVGEATCPICLCQVEDSYGLEACAHKFCRSCLVEQCESAIKSSDSFPVCCTHEGCGTPIWLTDLKYILSSDKLEELFKGSLGAFVTSSGGAYRFCPSPDCPSIYQVSDSSMTGEPFVCGACFVETCTRCHSEYHPDISCEMYQEFKEDPDLSLKEWCKGKDSVKTCPICGYTIEKVDGCNHVECRCGRHICWACLEYFGSSDDCYGHLRSVHLAII